MVSLLLRNLLFMLLQPGLVTGLIPWLLLRGSDRSFVPETWSGLHFIGIFFATIGLTVLMICIWRFPFEEKGTISPLDPTERLVVHGLYRYSRNPMYVGAIVLLIGESLYWASPTLAIYTAVLFVGFNLFIMLHEEPRLKRDFPVEYELYCAKVRRWL